MNLKEYLSYYKVKSQREEKLSRNDVAGRIVSIGQLPSFSAALFLYHSNFLSNRRYRWEWRRYTRGRKAEEVAKGQGNGWGIKFACFASRLLASTYSLCPSSVVSSFSQSLIKVQLQVKLKHDNVAVREGERERGDLLAVAYPFLLFFLRWPNLSSCVPIVPHHLRASRRSLAAELLNTRLSGVPLLTCTLVFLSCK